jgi:hypothetical protein
MEAMMTKTPDEAARKPAGRQQTEQKIDKSSKPGDAALSDDDLKKVTGGPIYRGGGGTG